MPAPNPVRHKRDLFEGQRTTAQKSRPMRARSPQGDVVASLETKITRQRDSLTALHTQHLKCRAELDKANVQAAANELEIRRLRQQLTKQTRAADDHAKFQGDLIAFGTGAVQDQRIRAETAEAKATQLQSAVTELESSVSSLGKQITSYEAAMTDESDDYTRSCLEAQAQGSVRMVQGYQKEIARHKSTAEALRETVAQRDKALRELAQQETERSRELEETKRQLAASKRLAAAMQGIADEQNALIERLNAENTNLASGGMTR